MKKAYSETIKELRQNHGYRQTEVAERLQEIGIPTTPSQVSRWENGLNNPTIDQFIGLCGIYGVANVFDVFGSSDALRARYDLNREGQKKLMEYRQLLIASGLYAADASEDSRVILMPKRTLPMYDIGASAGTGQFLDSDSYELVDVPDYVPDTANFGLHVAGDSMEPTLEDGQEIWVHMQPTLESGETGIFFLDGNAYVKEYMKSGKKVTLVSHNRQYEPIEVSSDVEARIYGKVVFPQC